VRGEILQMRFELKGDGSAELAALRAAIDAAFAELLRAEGVGTAGGGGLA
jgi:hypothetical protein